MRIARIALDGRSAKGSFTGEMRFGPGLNVVTAPNSFGKSILATAVPWCLGLEPIFGVANNDPSRFPLALRDAIDLGEHKHVPVLSSTAQVEFERDDGAVLRLRRPIHGGELQHVTVEEPANVGGASKTSTKMIARFKTMADASGGLQRFLFGWFGLSRHRLMTKAGSEAEIYLENLLPLFFIDQNEGWSDLQALQVYRYGLVDIGPAAVEALLGASATLERRFLRQRAAADESMLKSQAERIAERVSELFARSGWSYSLSTHGSPGDIASRWGDIRLDEVAAREFNFNFEGEVTRLESLITRLRAQLANGTIDPQRSTAPTAASQKTIELKEARHAQATALRDARAQLAEQESLLTSLSHRILSTQDLLRLKRAKVGRLGTVECPTCHRHLDPSTFELSDQSAESVETHLDVLKNQQRLVRRNVESLQFDVARAGAELEKISEDLRMAQRSLDTVNAAIGTTREELAKCAGDLSAAERELDRTREIKSQLRDLQEAMQRWIAGVGERELGSIEGPDLAERRAVFENKLGTMLAALGHSAVTRHDERIRLDEDYVPYLGPRRLRSLGSASDHPRLVAGYSLALAEASRVLRGPHPGFVLLDEPLQQNPDAAHRELMVRSLAEGFGTQQIQTIVLTHLLPAEVARVRAGKVNLQVRDGEYLLTRSA